MSKKNTAEVGVQYDRAWSPIAVWNGYEKGDLVHVTGTAGCEFRFAYAHERDGFVTEVTVVGGPSQHSQFRTFRADRITSPNAQQRRRAIRREKVSN